MLRYTPTRIRRKNPASFSRGVASLREFPPRVYVGVFGASVAFVLKTRDLAQPLEGVIFFLIHSTLPSHWIWGLTGGGYTVRYSVDSPIECIRTRMVNGRRSQTLPEVDYPNQKDSSRKGGNPPQSLRGKNSRAERKTSLEKGVREAYLTRATARSGVFHLNRRNVV